MGLRPNRGGGLEAWKIGCNSGPILKHARRQFEYCTGSLEGAAARGAYPRHRLWREGASWPSNAMQGVRQDALSSLGLLLSSAVDAAAPG
jgi:hypothetical protein